MPEAIAGPFCCRPKTTVATGPVMAEVRIAGSQTRGLRTMLPIWSIEVPRPWAKKPPQLLSRKERTAKPTIWALQPARAAPPARPVRPRAAQIAALEIGSVRAMPTVTETRVPITRGCSSVAHMMK